MNIYLLRLWLVPLLAFLSAGVIVATDKRVRRSQSRSISDRGLIAVIGEQTNPRTFAELDDEATSRIEPASMYPIRAPGGLSGGVITAWLGGELVDRLAVGVDNGAHLNAPSSLSGRPAAAEPVQPMRRAS